MKTKAIITALLILISFQNGWSQTWCNTPEVSIQSAEEDDFNNYVIQYKQNGGHLNTDVKKIPTVIHIIYRNNSDSIKMSSIRINNVINKCNEQLRRLNDDAIQTRPMFKSIAADCHIQVCLATKKPNGNSFDGVVYYHKPSWNTFTDYNAFVGANMFDRTKYLNVFVTPDEEAGSAVFPWDANDSIDGFHIGSKLFGVYEPDMEDWGKEGTTFVHELAHYLGVYHTFHNSNFYLSQCEYVNDSTIGDRCGDTPLDWDFPSSGNQCNDGVRNCDIPGNFIVAQTENYMYYNMDSCTNMFSKDQRARMRACLDSLRSSLVSSSNLTFTGVQCETLLSINHLTSDESIKIFPNPAKDDITVIRHDKHVNSEILIFDISGKIVSKNKLSVDIHTLSIRNLNPGVYFMVIKSEYGCTTKKIIIQ